MEIDPEVFKIAKQYFGLMDSTRLKVEINDGIEYLKKESANNKHYQSVLFDVDNKDYSLGLGCPPKIFLSEEIIDAVKTLIGVDGLFVLNLVCRDELLRDSVLQDLKKSFGTIYSYKLEEELNEILYCQTSSTLNETLIEKAVMQFLDISKHNKLKNDLELTEFMESLKKC